MNASVSGNPSISYNTELFLLAKPKAVLPDTGNKPAMKNILENPNELASGYLKILRVEEGLTYRLVDYKLKKDFEYIVSPSGHFHLIINFYEFTFPNKLRIEIGKDVIENESGQYRAILMTNSTVAQKLSLQKDTQVRGLTIMISADWITRKLKDPNGPRFDMLKNTNLLLDYLTARYQKILNDIFEEKDHSSIPSLFVTSRVLRLLERFLDATLKRGAVITPASINFKDFQTLVQIESLLLTHYDREFPKIENLARIALMSESKLKRLFKQAFGMGLYEYYQKNRMHKAKQMLSSGQFSVTQVGVRLGYQNLSNFSTSFKKEFNQFPKDYQLSGAW